MIDKELLDLLYEGIALVGLTVFIGLLIVFVYFML